MDNFISKQHTEGRATAEGSFTLSAANTRRKLMESAPNKHPEAKLLLLLGALHQAGYDPDTCLKLKIFRWEREYFVRNIKASLKNGQFNHPQVLFDALNEPFRSPDQATTQFTQFAYWSAGLGFPVNIKWRGGRMNFSKSALEVDGDLSNETDELTVELKLPDKHLRHTTVKRAREAARALYTPTQLLPEEAFQTFSPLSDYFQDRAKPCVLLKRFVHTEALPCIQIDLWESPFSEISPDLLLMDRAKPGNWLSRLWRPKYGRPAFMLQHSSGKATFGKLNCKAIFWVELSDKTAAVSFSRGDFFRDFVDIQGPPGLRARVVWDTLKTDAYGWDIVNNDEYQEATAWCEKQAHLMKATLREHWEKAHQAVGKYGLVKSRYYEKEVKDRMKALWG